MHWTNIKNRHVVIGDEIPTDMDILTEVEIKIWFNGDVISYCSK